VCNLRRLNNSANQIEDVFAAARPAEINAGEAEVYPGGRGTVERKQDGAQIVQAITWGFLMRISFMKPDSKRRRPDLTDQAPPPQHWSMLNEWSDRDPDCRPRAKYSEWWIGALSIIAMMLIMGPPLYVLLSVVLR
jgi:hypothetical protein